MQFYLCWCLDKNKDLPPPLACQKPWLLWKCSILVCDYNNTSDNQLHKEEFIFSRTLFSSFSFWKFLTFYFIYKELTLFLCKVDVLDDPFKEAVNIVSPLHTNLQVENFQRCERAFHQHQAWVKLQLGLCLLLLTILQLYHLPPPLPPPISNSSCLFTRFQPLYASCCTVLFSYCTIKNVSFIFCLFVLYVLFVWKVL